MFQQTGPCQTYVVFMAGAAFAFFVVMGTAVMAWLLRR